MKDNSSCNIKLSQLTYALIESLKSIKAKPRPDDLSALTVSQTVSFFALVYEKIRNAVEFRDDHLILRAAIERILKRRISLNPEGKGEAENLLRELLWARYFANGSLGNYDIENTQKIIDRYIKLRNLLLVGRDGETQHYLNQFLLDLITAEIEETLRMESAIGNANKSFFIYQVLRKKIKIDGLTENEKDIYFLVSIEKVFRKSDKSYQRYHLFTTFYKPIKQYTMEEIENFASKLPEIFKKIDVVISSSYVDKINNFLKKQLAPFIILFELLKTKLNEAGNILTNKDRLWNEVDLICRAKYQQLSKRITNLAIKSFIYILLTKMLFAIILEFPLSYYLFGEINKTSIIINSLFPPFLMVAIVATFRVPGEGNTKKIYQRIIQIIDADNSFETQIAFVRKRETSRKSILIFGFTVFYLLTFFVTLSLIYEILTLLNFNLISQVIFIFFVSVVTFFSYRVKQIVSEVRLEDKENIITPLIDFFRMPILSLGKFFSQEIAKFNFFIFIFDFLIEAPFKLIFEIIEEWISFVRKRKEEII